MNNQNIFIGLAIFIVGVFCGIVINNISNGAESPVLVKTIHEIPEGMHLMPDGSLMARGDRDTGDMDHGMMIGSEREFIEGMIPHHQEAIDTAKEVLARGATAPEIHTLAENIIAAQEQEIIAMKQWYEVWYGTPYQASGAYTPMMRDLSPLSGATLDKAFLEDMIMHHMGAIMMAQSVVPHIIHAEITTLTSAIIETQSREIGEMRRMLESL